MSEPSIAVVGAGAWGTALAQAMAKAGRRTALWARNPALVAEIAASRINSVYLPGIPLDPRVEATSALSVAARADILLLVVPAQRLRDVGSRLAPHVRPGQPVIICSKGIESATGKRLSEVLAEIAPAATPAVLSGPSFAHDVARGLPAAVTLAAANEDVGKRLMRAIGTRTLRPYWTSDIVGVELGGAAKTVLTIAAGIVKGRELGDSAHAGLVTRGVAELVRFCLAHGARPETPLGLSGLGDLILTCNSMASRNMSLGHALGKGESLERILAGRKAVSEGATNAAAVARMAAAKGVDMPIASAVAGVIAGTLSVDAAIDALLSRPFKAET